MKNLRDYLMGYLEQNVDVNVHLVYGAIDYWERKQEGAPPRAPNSKQLPAGGVTAERGGSPIFIGTKLSMGVGLPTKVTLRAGDSFWAEEEIEEIESGCSSQEVGALDCIAVNGFAPAVLIRLRTTPSATATLVLRNQSIGASWTIGNVSDAIVSRRVVGMLVKTADGDGLGKELDPPDGTPGTACWLLISNCFLVQAPKFELPSP